MLTALFITTCGVYSCLCRCTVVVMYVYLTLIDIKIAIKNNSTSLTLKVYITQIQYNVPVTKVFCMQVPLSRYQHVLNQTEYL